MPKNEKFQNKPKPNDDVAGLPSRRAALSMMEAVQCRAQSLDQAAVDACRRLPANDKAHAIAIIHEALRWQVDLDALIDSKTQKILDYDAKPRMVLRIALAQMLVLKTPSHAAISTALPLVEKGPRKLVHGVMGALYRDQATLPMTPSLPEKAITRWSKNWGDDVTDAASRALLSPPPLDLMLKTPADHDDIMAQMQDYNPISFANGHIRLGRGSAVEHLPGYDDGTWWVQDIAASLPARLAGDGVGKTALDLCAAPGGKTMQLAAAGFDVTALDISKRRIERLRQNLKRMDLDADIVCADIGKWDNETQFDVILLDAPCTASGTFRRHPDVLQRIDNEDIARLAEKQSALLLRATEWVKLGGIIIYATCSLEREEGENQIQSFLSENDGFVIDKIDDDIIPIKQAIAADGWIRTLPQMMIDEGGVDGFFAVAIKRVK